MIWSGNFVSIFCFSFEVLKKLGWCLQNIKYSWRSQHGKYSLTWEMYRQGQNQGKREITKFCDFIFYLILTPEIGKIYIVLGLLRPIEVHRCHVARWLKLFEMLLLLAVIWYLFNSGKSNWVSLTFSEWHAS